MDLNERASVLEVCCVADDVKSWAGRKQFCRVVAYFSRGSRVRTGEVFVDATSEPFTLLSSRIRGHDKCVT